MVECLHEREGGESKRKRKVVGRERRECVRERAFPLFYELSIPIESSSYLQALSHPYFQGLANPKYEPEMKPIPKSEFEFEKKKLTKEDVRELIYREVCH